MKCRIGEFINKRYGKLSLETKEARKFKEDSHRLKGAKGDYIIYKVESPINSFKVYSFFPDKISDFKFLRLSQTATASHPSNSAETITSPAKAITAITPLSFTKASQFRPTCEFLKIEYERKPKSPASKLTRLARSNLN